MSLASTKGWTPVRAIPHSWMQLATGPTARYNESEVWAEALASHQLCSRIRMQIH